jgi:hypothetical protein
LLIQIVAFLQGFQFEDSPPGVPGTAVSGNLKTVEDESQLELWLGIDTCREKEPDLALLVAILVSILEGLFLVATLGSDESVLSSLGNGTVAVDSVHLVLSFS